jgi:hypothetical protein
MIYTVGFCTNALQTSSIKHLPLLIHRTHYFKMLPTLAAMKGLMENLGGFVLEYMSLTGMYITQQYCRSAND